MSGGTPLGKVRTPEDVAELIVDTLTISSMVTADNCHRWRFYHLLVK